MTLSIIIVNWNVKPLLERCLFSIFQHAKGINYEVWVVDNASKDSSQEYLRNLSRRKTNLGVILNNKNLGFAQANNQALKKAQGEFILLLNPDAEILDGALQKMIQFIGTSDDCGVVGCQLIGVDGKVQPSVRNFPTIWSQLMIFLKLHYLFPRAKSLRNYFLYNFDYGKKQEVDQVMGAFLMTRRQVLEEVGLLDDRFFLWFEEVDFCKRVKEAGWKVIYNSEAIVLHHGSQSFRQMMSFTKQRIYNKSAIYYFRKHFPLRVYWPLILFNPISLFLALLVQFFARPNQNSLSRRRI